MSDHHLALDRFAAGEELGLGDDRRAAAAGFAPFAAALLLGFEAGGPADAGDLVFGGAAFANLDHDVVRVVGRRGSVLAGSGTLAAAAGARVVGAVVVGFAVVIGIGSVSGGWLSSAMIKRGATVNRARKTALFVASLGVLPILFADKITGLWTAVLMLGLVTAAHQAFSSNLYTLVSDMFPRRAVATIAGFGGMFGYMGASLFQVFVGYSVEKQQNYTLPFICVSVAYLLAFGVIHLLAPRLEPAVIPEPKG